MAANPQPPPPPQPRAGALPRLPAQQGAAPGAPAPGAPAPGAAAGAGAGSPAAPGAARGGSRRKTKRRQQKRRKSQKKRRGLWRGHRGGSGASVPPTPLLLRRIYSMELLSSQTNDALSGVVDLSISDVTNGDIEKIIEISPELSSLTQLELTSRRGTERTDDTLRLLAAISGLPNLTRLTLSMGIDDTAASVLADSLRHLPALQYLSLGRNSIGDDGCIALLSAMESCPALTRLELYRNHIGDAGCIALCASPLFSRQLITLNLHDNSIAEAGLSAIATALPSTITLRSLILYGNALTPDIQLSISRAARSRPAALPRLRIEFVEPPEE